MGSCGKAIEQLKIIGSSQSQNFIECSRKSIEKLKQTFELIDSMYEKENYKKVIDYCNLVLGLSPACKKVMLKKAKSLVIMDDYGEDTTILQTG